MNGEIRKRVLDATGFSLPDPYVALYADGRLQFGESRADWEANWRTITMTKPPALLCSPWFWAVEWDTIDELIEWKPPDNWKPNRFLCFAKNGYGDCWVWDRDRETERGTAVVLCRHDEDSAEVVAASFSDFLYRILLEGFAHISYDTRDELGLDDAGFKRQLGLNIDAVAPHIPDHYVQSLRSVLLNELLEYEEEERYGLLQSDEKRKIIERDLAVEGVGVTFSHRTRSSHAETANEEHGASKPAWIQDENAWRRQQDYGQATNEADEAFRNGDYRAYCELLADFFQMLTPTQEKKLVIANRKLQGGSA